MRDPACICDNCLRADPDCKKFTLELITPEPARTDRRAGEICQQCIDAVIAALNARKEDRL